MINIYKQVKRSFAVISALFITVVRGDSLNCDSQKLLQCVDPLKELTDSGLTFATNRAELDRMCPRLRDTLRCIHSFSRQCMTLQERAHFRILFNGTNHMVQHLCKNEEYQKQYFRYTPCMKEADKYNDVCLNRYTEDVKRIQESTEIQTTPEPNSVIYQKRKREAANENIKSVCCSFQEYIDCSTQTMRRACGEEAAQFSQGFLNKISSALLQMHCRQYGRRECGLISAADTVNTSLLFLIVLSLLAYSLR